MLGPERNQKTVLFQNFGGQTREINVGNGGFTLLCKPPGIFKDQKERKGMLTFIDIAEQFYLTVTPQQNSQRSCLIQVPRFGN